MCLFRWKYSSYILSNLSSSYLQLPQQLQNTKKSAFKVALVKLVIF